MVSFRRLLIGRRAPVLSLGGGFDRKHVFCALELAWLSLGAGVLLLTLRAGSRIGQEQIFIPVLGGDFQ